MLGRLAAVATIVAMALSTRAWAGSEMLVDNSLVRVSLNTYLPGEASGDHEHVSPRFVYVLDDGTLETTTPAGDKQSHTLAAGTCMYDPPVRHSVRNGGDSTLRLLEIEVKEGSGPARGRTQRCSSRAAASDRPRAGRLQRTLLFASVDLVVSRITIPPGARDRSGSIHGPRLIFVLEGRSLASRTVGGGKAIATSEAALWVDEDAPLVNQDARGELVVLEMTTGFGSAAVDGDEMER